MPMTTTDTPESVAARLRNGCVLCGHEDRAYETVDEVATDKAMADGANLIEAQAAENARLSAENKRLLKDVATLRVSLRREQDAVETFLDAYRKRYSRPSTGGIRSDAPMRADVAELVAAVTNCAWTPNPETAADVARRSLASAPADSEGDSHAA